MNTFITKTFFGFYLLSLLAIASAQDGLYAPEPPANSAFVRVVHAALNTTPISPQLGTLGFSELGFGGISPYQVITEGDYTFSAAGSSQSLSMVAGNFYTVAVIDNGSGAHIKLIKDASNSNMAKSLLMLYNFSAFESAHMKTADGKQAVIADVAAETMGSVIVNPISIDLAAFGPDLIDSFPAQLERGAAYSLFIMGSADEPSSYFVPSVTQ